MSIVRVSAEKYFYEDIEVDIEKIEYFSIYSLDDGDTIVIFNDRTKKKIGEFFLSGAKKNWDGNYEHVYLFILGFLKNEQIFLDRENSSGYSLLTTIKENEEDEHYKTFVENVSNIVLDSLVDKDIFLNNFIKKLITNHVATHEVFY